MIEWMQTHRKWLVITIWVATIAFIGAGFVGWGQFQLARKASVVAEIKDTEVTIKDVQTIYQNLFNQYNAQMGGKLDEATAKKLGLDKIALQQAIQQGILIQYAKDLGLYVTDKELAQKILSVFKSDKNYRMYLKANGLTAKDFETTLRKQLLVEKLLNFLNIKPTKTELLTTASALYNADNLEIKIIKKSEVPVNLSEKEIKEYYEKHKNEFLSEKKYKIALIKIPLKVNASNEELKKFYEENKLNYKNEKGEILPFEKVIDEVKRDYAINKLRKKAILSYKKLKENKGNYEILTITATNDTIPADKLNDLIKNGYLKPFVNKNYYVTAKLLEEIAPKPLSFKKARGLVVEKLIEMKSIRKLKEIAKKEYKIFKGKKLGFITKFDVNKLKLQPMLSTEILQTIFTSLNPNYYVLAPEGSPQVAVLYRIKEQKLLDKEKYEKNKEIVYNLTQALVNNELLNDLINKLSQEYKIEVYVKE